MPPTPSDKRILLDLSDLSGDDTPVSLFEFIQDNSAPGIVPLDEDDVRQMRRLRPGQAVHLGIGGGAVRVKRVASIREPDPYLVVAGYRESASRFESGDHVRVKDSHGSAKFRGDEGTIDRYVPFGKYYVELKRNGRSLVSEEDLEKSASKAASMLPLDEARLVAYLNGAIIKAIREAGGKNINTVLSLVERSGLYTKFVESIIDAVQQYADEVPARRASQNFPWHAGAVADDGVSDVYLKLLSIKGAMDRMEEIPKDLVPLYDQVGKAIGLLVAVKRETHQARMMMRSLANRYR